MTMHVPAERPACWVQRVFSKYQPVFIDDGMSCGNFRTKSDEVAALHLTPTCAGCARMKLARALRGRNTK